MYVVGDYLNSSVFRADTVVIESMLTHVHFS